MEQPSPQEHVRALVLPDEDLGQKCYQFKGIRLRKWGSWVAETRMPRSRQKLWLGSYATAQQAARSYDAAVYCLRGPNSKFNFPNSVPDIPSASSLSRRQIQLAAAKYALDQLPNSSPPSLQENEKNNKKAASPSRSASLSETEMSSVSHQILEKHDELDIWESLFEGSEGNDGLNLERMPSTGEASALDFISRSWQEQLEEWHMNILVDPTENLWIF